MQTERRSSPVGLWIALAILGVLLIVSFVANIGLFVGMLSGGATPSASLAARGGGPEDEYPRFTERWSYGSGNAKAVRIALDGVISRENAGGFFGAPVDPTESVLRQIRAAMQDSSVAAILIEINSPGGGVTPSDEIHAALKTFRESRDDRRVVAFVRDLCASGGYYVAVAADTIVVEPTAILGSIGVIMQSLNWNGFTQMVGVEDVTIKSGANKDLLNPFRPVNPDQLVLLQKMVDSMYGQFVTIVAEGRELERTKIEKLADGRVFTAQEGLKLKLVDRIGYFDDALAAVRELLEEENVRFVRYEHRTSLLDLFVQARQPALDLKALVPRNQGPQFMYLWKP